MFTACLLGQVLSPALLAEHARIWYAIPLIVVISLVYGATRHENPREIVAHAFRSGVGVTVFMAVIFAVIYIAGFWN